MSVPTSASYCIQSHSTAWINQDNPLVGGGDFEGLTKSERDALCIGGQITAIECSTVDGHPWKSSGDVVTCDLNDGLSCRNAENTPDICSDYKIRYFCQCAELSSPGASVPTPGTTVVPNPVSTDHPTMHVRCAWSSWLNSDRPQFGSGDLETISGLKSTFGLCKNIVDIQCRVTSTHQPAADAGQNVLCDVVNGLRCYNGDQTSEECYDYEVKVLCWSPECTSPPTGTVSTITPVCPPGHTWQPCAYKCNQLCQGYAQMTNMCESGNLCIPSCQSMATKSECGPGELLKDERTCVKTEMCPCVKPDGSLAQPYETWTDATDSCTVCSCKNNTITCTKLDNCPPTITVSTTSQVIVHPDCQWTSWINTDLPSIGVGDIETISKIRQLNQFCANPVMIECRDVYTQQLASSRGQKVTCDLTTGFKCLNWDNGNSCDDYEVRFFCPCFSTQTVATPGLQSHLSPTAVPGTNMAQSPTAVPNLQPGQSPTAQPNLISGQSPTAQPNLLSGQSPTAQPNLLSGQSPTAQPNLLSGQSPTAQPNLLSGQSPTAEPKLQSGQSPTAQPNLPSGQSPTAQPNLLSGQSPTAQPNLQSGQSPTAQPNLLSGQSPTAQPNLLSGQSPTAEPKLQSGQSPTAEPKLQSGQSPTAQPNLLSGQSPTAQPNLQSGQSPTAQPNLLSGQSPTAQPNLLSGQSPTAQPNLLSVQSPTAQPNLLSGQSPTAQPNLLPGQSPTAQPNLLSGQSPTAQPNLLSGQSPTAQPNLLSGQSPTAQPNLLSGQSPTAQPNLLSGQSPTAQPNLLSGQSPTAQPNLLSGQSPTAQPNLLSGQSPTAQPNLLSGQSPTAQPNLLSGQSPTAKPNLLSGESPTAEPKLQSGQSPTAQPNLLSGQSPTAQPNLLSGQSPTAQPNLLSGQSPTAEPKLQSGQSPTAQPNLVSGQSPTAQPNLVSGQSPTAQPNLLSGQSPTAQPNLQSGQSPTAQPNLLSGQSPTAQPNLLSGQSPTAQPNLFTGQSPTAMPNLHSGQSPTAVPNTLPTVTPTAGPVLCGWTSWMDGHRPDMMVGESEIFSELRPIYHFCADGDIQGIQCRAVGTHQLINETDQINVICDIPSGGLMCFGFDQPTGECYNYEIRVFCEPKGMDCSGAPTAAPPRTSGSEPTAAPNVPSFEIPSAKPGLPSGETPTARPILTSGSSPNICENRWSSWVDRDNTRDGFEIEFMTPSELMLFCPLGRISAIDCRTVDAETPYYSAGETVKCTVQDGFMCNDSDNQPIPCSNYKVRYQCECLETTGVVSPHSGPHITGIRTTAEVTPHSGPQVTGITAPPTPSGPTPTSTAFPPVCVQRMGMSDGSIEGHMITVSSSRDGNLNPQSARLDGPGAWVAEVNDQSQHIQINFMALRLVTGVVTQGRAGAGTFVTSYKVLYSSDGYQWNVYQTNGIDKVFQGNTDATEHVTNMFEHPVRAQYIRIVPLTWNGVIAMRLEIIGCFEPYPRTTAEVTPHSGPQVTGIRSTATATPYTGPSFTATKPTIAPSCIEWDNWVNQGHPTLTSGGDSEPFAAILASSFECLNPVVIQCARAHDELSYELTGQKVECNTWTGLTCINKDNAPTCFDYKARIGCLKNAPGCIIQEPPTLTSPPPKTNKGTTAVIKITTQPCFEGMDMSACPVSCPPEHYCNGLTCVRKSECNCMVDGKVVANGHFVENSNCATCQCISGEIQCMPKVCPNCTDGFSQQLDLHTCQCGCVTCDKGEYRCGNGQCISSIYRCDGIIDCVTDEIGCTTVPSFTPPYIVTGVTSNMTNIGTPVMTLAPRLCTSGWTDWINTDTPDVGDGDKEKWTAVQLAQFCTGKVDEIECATVDDIRSYSSGEVNQCSLEEGLVCLNEDNAPIPCSDYKIRYHCSCEGIPTAAPVTGHPGTPTMVPPPVSGLNPTLEASSTVTFMSSSTTPYSSTSSNIICQDKFTGWINKDSPNTGDGDHEYLTPEQLAEFCPIGRVSQLECVTDYGIPSYSSGEIIECSIDRGLICLNEDNSPMPCSDYKIRYHCTCEENTPPTVPTTPIPTPPTIRHTKPPHSIPHHSGPTPAFCQTGYGRWINRDSPSSGDGDHEGMNSTELSVFCPQGSVTRIECETTTGLTSDSTGEIHTCDINSGLICNNEVNPGSCSDYRVRYYCDCYAQPMINTQKTIVFGTTTIPVCIRSTCPVAVRPTLFEGEQLQTITDEFGCCTTYRKVCLPETCSPKMPQPCAAPAVFEPLNMNNCCPTYTCRCPLVCPEMIPPKCPQGQTLVEISGACNCSQFACSTPPVTTTPSQKVCRYQMSNSSTPQTFPMNSTWTDGFCRTCLCSADMNGNPTYTCQEEVCPPCRLGSVRDEVSDECCGNCKEYGCAVNGTVYRDGQSIRTDQKCYTQMCRYDVGSAGYIVTQNHVTCPPEETLPICSQGQAMYDAQGCCKQCVPANTTCTTCSPRAVFSDSKKSVGFFRVRDQLEVCENLEPVADLLECGGYCDSKSSYTSVMTGFQSTCNCCSVTSTISKDVTLTCPSGRTITRSYKVPTSCGCSQCKAGAKRK